MIQYSKKRKGRIVLGILSFVLLMQFTPSSPTLKTDQLKQEYIQQLEQKLNTLNTLGLAFKYNPDSIASLQRSILETRKAYKKIEFLLEYYYPHYAEEHLNGAPLLHIKRHDTRAFVIPPEGMQVLDELLFSDEGEERALEVSQLVQKLQSSADQLLYSFKSKKITLQELIESSRLQMVRIFTLSLTGFDTPGSLNAIEESVASLEGIFSFLNPYFKESISSTQKLEKLFTEAINYLEKENSFEALDRLSFLKKFIDPMYNELGKWQLAEKLNTNASSYTSNTPWNQRSTSLFATDFLNPYYYTELNADEDNPDLRALGKQLFYDKQLSAGNQLSCGSCHKLELAFTDGKPKSESSLAGRSVQRNSPTLLNAVYADRYFYDLRAFSLEQQAKHVVFNPHEFNNSSSQIIEKINTQHQYKEPIQKAFKKDQLNKESFIQALTSYVLSLQSFNSPFDQYVRGESRKLDKKAKLGFNLFMGKANCGTCHFAPTFAGLVPPNFAKNESEILGVLEKPDIQKLDSDQGRLANKLYNEQAWIYEKSFKTVTVRNTELTAPYFHNGAYPSLESVVNFYNHGGGAGLGLDVSNQTLSSDSLHLSTYEKEALIAFMKSLTDNSAANEQE